MWRITEPATLAPMIRRTHRSDTMQSYADYSGCMAYRYSLHRSWDPSKPQLTYVMLNPSRATEQHNDPTIERCQRRAAALGFGAMMICNLFALRATDPADLKRAKDPIGPECDTALRQACASSAHILCAWGVHGTLMDRAAQVLTLLQGLAVPLTHLGLTKHGHPRHPLYVPYATQPQPW